MKYKVKVPKTRIKPNQGGQGGRALGGTTNRGGVIESRTFDKKRILREIRQPLKEIKELPKTTKLKGYLESDCIRVTMVNGMVALTAKNLPKLKVLGFVT